MTDPITINYSSFRSVLGNKSKQAVLYGSEMCKWSHIFQLHQLDQLSGIRSIPKIFDWKIAKLPELTHEGTLIETLPFYLPSGLSLDKNTPYFCKAALVNIVYENMKREKTGLPLIPVVFMTEFLDKTERTQNPFVTTPLDVLHDPDHRITHKELRRVHKLCEDLHLPDSVKAVARKTFKFVRVELQKPSERYLKIHSLLLWLGSFIGLKPFIQSRLPPSSPYYTFTQIPALWTSEQKTEWNRHHSHRRLLKLSRPRIASPKPINLDWRTQLYNLSSQL